MSDRIARVKAYRDKHGVSLREAAEVINSEEMTEGKVVVTLSQTVQIGIDEWQQRRISRVFSLRRSLADMLHWAESEGITNPTVTDLIISQYTGESI